MADSDIVEYEKESGLATRARTRLIVEGYSNLALIAVLFTGVQAQLISVTNENNDSAIEVATNAVFFGGLMFSVFTAVLAVLSGRWFSILRDDDSDYLSSRWLAADSADLEKKEKRKPKVKRPWFKSRFRIRTHKYQERKPDLEKYLASQIDTLEARRKELLKPKSRPTSVQKVDPINSGSAGQSAGPTGESADRGGDMNQDAILDDSFNPTVFDIDHILLLLRREQEEKGPNFTRKSMAEGKDSRWLRGREWILSLVLISPIFVAVPAFALFCAGILMLAWNKQPLAVAIFTSITVFICVLLLIGFFLQHRRKHVIRKLHLKRPAV